MGNYNFHLWLLHSSNGTRGNTCYQTGIVHTFFLSITSAQSRRRPSAQSTPDFRGAQTHPGAVIRAFVLANVIVCRLHRSRVSRHELSKGLHGPIQRRRSYSSKVSASHDATKTPHLDANRWDYRSDHLMGAISVDH